MPTSKRSSRQARFSDLPSQQQMQIAALAAAACVYVPGGDDEVMLLSDTGGGCTAFAAWRQIDTEAELLGIAVQEKLRGQGIGSALLEALSALWQAAGVGKVYLEVRAGNTAAQRLYEGGGFVLCGRRRAYYPPPAPGGEREDALVMMKEIKA